MGPVLSYVLPYYMNPGMLAEHYRTWAAYPDALKARLEVVIVDDGSPMPQSAATVPWPLDLPRRQLYRVLEDRPWNQHGARNLGAKEATGAWLFLCDMDHVVPADTLRQMLALCNHEAIYTFGRVDAPDMRPRMKNGAMHFHPNTFLMPRSAYWRIGGYDEDLTGYGTDSFFRTRLADAGVPIVQRADIRLVRYPREVIADASTCTLPRKDGRPPGHKARLRAIAAEKRRRGQGPAVITFPWARLL